MESLQSVSSTLGTALSNDKWVYRWVVIFLGLAVVITVTGSIGMAIAGQTTGLPDGVVAIASAAVGALAGLLAPSPSQHAG